MALFASQFHFTFYNTTEGFCSHPLIYLKFVKQPFIAFSATHVKLLWLRMVFGGFEFRDTFGIPALPSSNGPYR